MIRILVTIFAGLLGLAFGSFLNVCLSRWPAGESVVTPRSHCRNCDHVLAWWENVPLVSWLALRGRCRKCHSWIGWRYPLVELAVSVVWALMAWRSFLSFFPLYYAEGMMAFTWVLVGLAVLDAEHHWLPDLITLPGVALGIAFVFIGGAMVSHALETPSEPWRDAREAGMWLLGVLAAALIILLIRWIYWLIRRREGIGLGDAKLMALLAAWLDFPHALVAFFIGVVLGAGVALAQLAIPAGRNPSDGWALRKLPLGTFLCIGGIVSALWGQPIIAMYLRWAGF